MRTGNTAMLVEPDAERGLLDDEHRDRAPAERTGAGDHEVESLRIPVGGAAGDAAAEDQAGDERPRADSDDRRDTDDERLPLPLEVVEADRGSRWTMMKPTTAPASASGDELDSRSSGKMPVRKPIRKMIDATNSDDSSDLVRLATKSLIVHTSMTMTNASIEFTTTS